MARFTARDRVIGNWVLAAMFTLAAIATGLQAWALLRTDGFTTRAIIWLLAVFGFSSLIARTVRAATLSANDSSLNSRGDS